MVLDISLNTVLCSVRWSSCTDSWLWESLCGTSLLSQCSSASSGWFCSSFICAQTYCLATPLWHIRESCSSCSWGVMKWWKTSFFFGGVFYVTLLTKLVMTLNSVSECCASPYSLLGLTFVVSYLALGLLNLCKFYLGGYAAIQNDNVMHRWSITSNLWSPFFTFLVNGIC